MTFPAGADALMDAPTIGFGVSEVTPNYSLTPTTFATAGDEPRPDLSVEAIRTAWWKFVAPKDCWVRFDLHKSTCNLDPTLLRDPGKPETAMAIYIGEPPGQLWCLASGTTSVPAGKEEVTFDATWGIQYNWTSTSELLVKVDAGWTYYVQAGMNYDYATQDPDAFSVYVLTVSEMICRATEVVVPTVGPIYNSPDGSASAGTPIIVGGDDAWRRDSTGYVEYPDTLNGSGQPTGACRVGAWMQGLNGNENWPPPLGARFPGGSSPGLQLAFRYEAEVLPNNKNRGESGITWIEGNQGGTYQYYMSLTPYPNLGGGHAWDPSVDNGEEQDRVPSRYGNWRDADGGWGYLYDNAVPPNFLGYVKGPAVKDRGVVMGVNLSSTEDFLVDGEYRAPDPVELWDASDDPMTAIAKWYRWYGDWGQPPFHHASYGCRLFSLDPQDYSVWFDQTYGYTIKDGVEFAMPFWGMRVHWIEWIVRWVTFEEKKPELTGGPAGTARAFSDG